MSYNIAINGYGKIGRLILRAYYESGCINEFKIKAINEISNINKIAYLTKYDTTYGSFQESVSNDNKSLHINKDVISVYSLRDISLLPWEELNIDIVLECTGCFLERDELKMHLDCGAKKVVLSCPGSKDLDATIVYGINEKTLTAEHQLISNASCTSNCAVPIIKTLDDEIGIDCGMITTIHSMMNDQPVIDSYHVSEDLRRTRSSSQSIVPVHTELAKGVERILPNMAGRFQSVAMRVPTTTVSAIDLTIIASRDTDLHTVNEIFKRTSLGPLKGILGYTEEPLVSCDFCKDSRSAVIDGSQTRVNNSRMVRILSWFDNEWGYANRMLDTTKALLNQMRKAL